MSPDSRLVLLTGLSRQRGVVLLLLFIILFMVGTSLLITVVDNNVVRDQRNLDTMEALSKAKDALISYAVLHGDYYGSAGAGPGHLPCPDTNGSGNENTPCGANAFGRLPTLVTLPSGDDFILTDFGNDIDQQFWYALADGYRYIPASVLNSTTASNLSLDGQGGVAAILIAPGEAVFGQTRGNNTAANYLEANNSTSPSFITIDTVSPANFDDRVLAITQSEIMSLATVRVAAAIKTELDSFHLANGNYPVDQTEFDGINWAAGPAWLSNNNWLNVTVSTYLPISADSVSLTFTGCAIAYSIDSGVATMARSAAQC